MNDGPNRSTAARWGGLAAWLAITFVAALVGGVASMDAAERYQALVQPSWAPPSSVFGPVWTTLYALMAIAAWRVWWRAGWSGAVGPLALYLVQLAVNALWTWLFFAWELRGLATLEILLLIGLVVVLWRRFARIDRWAGVLLLPYLAWISFAAVLSGTVWQLNAGR